MESMCKELLCQLSYMRLLIKRDPQQAKSLCSVQGLFFGMWVSGSLPDNYC
jgi:hypothetical protein